jgi:hypothetical protein
MKLPLLAVLALSGVNQGYGQPANDTVARMKSCLKSDGLARQECVDRLWRELTYETTPPAPAQSSDGSWIVSETMSPLDYSPQITATKAFRSTGSNAPSSLTLGCRGQRTEIAVGTAGIWRPSRADELKVVHRMTNQPEVQERWAAWAGGRGALFRGDAFRFLGLLPDAGQIWIRIHDWQGPAHEATFQLTGLDAVRQKITAACKSAPAKANSAPAWR